MEKNYIIIKDFASCLTHFIGMIIAATATPFLIGRMVTLHASYAIIISCIIYCISLIGLYLASSSYHFFYDQTNTLKKIDHMMIFVLIAGSYTPICVALLGTSGLILLCIIWMIALIGIILMLYYVTCPKWISSTVYISMGWACVFVIPKIIQVTSPKGMFLLAFGGILYTVGGVIYALKLNLFNQTHHHFGSHEIFHCFVLAGSIFHYLFMYFELII